MQGAYWPLALYFALAVVTATGMALVSHFLGERHTGRTTAEPFEAGVPPTGAAGMRLDIRFYMVALFFVVFDIEAVFIYAWAVSVREAGWAGFAEMAVFISVLMVALLYLWRMGALDWGRRRSGSNG